MDYACRTQHMMIELNYWKKDAGGYYSLKHDLSTLGGQVSALSVSNAPSSVWRHLFHSVLTRRCGDGVEGG